MLSGRTPLWMRILHRIAPFLFRTCPSGNWHWRTEVICTCACSCGGNVLNLRTGAEYVYIPDGRRVQMLDVSGLDTEDQLRIVGEWRKALARKAAEVTPEPKRCCNGSC